MLAVRSPSQCMDGRSPAAADRTSINKSNNSTTGGKYLLQIVFYQQLTQEHGIQRGTFSHIIETQSTN